MAGSLIERLRARVEQLQVELAPESGFDRRAYGYGDEAGAEDATFEDLDREDESPWRRPESGPPRPEPAPGPEARGPETPRPRATPVRGSAAGRPEGFDPFRIRRGPSGGGIRRNAPPPPPGGAPARVSAPARSAGAPGAPAVDTRSTPRDPERGNARGADRSRRLRARLRQPESLRELFLLREVIDRPIALRRRPQGRSRG